MRNQVTAMANTTSTMLADRFGRVVGEGQESCWRNRGRRRRWPARSARRTIVIRSSSSRPVRPLGQACRSCLLEDEVDDAAPAPDCRAAPQKTPGTEPTYCRSRSAPSISCICSMVRSRSPIGCWRLSRAGARTPPRPAGRGLARRYRRGARSFPRKARTPEESGARPKIP